MTIKIGDIIKLFSREGRKFYFFIAERAGYLPRNIDIFRQAFVHKSASQGKRNNNERLEFLGDAVISAAVAEILYKKFPRFDEGQMSKLRAELVSRKRLNEIAIELQFFEHIKYFSSTGNVSKTHVPGDTIEAFVGAIYIDRGMKHARRFVKKHIADKRHIKKSLADLDTGAPKFKSDLLEWGQRNNIEVFFDTHMVDAPHENKPPTFESHVLIDGVITGKGRGRSKKNAEQRAAAIAIEKIDNDRLTPAAAEE